MQSKLFQNANVTARALDGELFILDDDDNRIHHLNITASAIWRFLETPATAKQVFVVFCQIYPDADHTKLKKALRKSLAWMRRKNILHRRKT